VAAFEEAIGRKGDHIRVAALVWFLPLLNSQACLRHLHLGRFMKWPSGSPSACKLPFTNQNRSVTMCGGGVHGLFIKQQKYPVNCTILKCAAMFEWTAIETGGCNFLRLLCKGLKSWCCDVVSWPAAQRMSVSIQKPGRLIIKRNNAGKHPYLVVLIYDQEFCRWMTQLEHWQEGGIGMRIQCWVSYWELALMPAM
jgi:hypothetical protein